MLAQDILQNYENKIYELSLALTNAQKRCEQYAQAYDSLLAQINVLQRDRFGKKSERYIDPEHPQLSLLEAIRCTHLFSS